MLTVENSNTDPTTSKSNTSKQQQRQQIPSTPSSGGGPSTSRGDGSSSSASSSSMGGSAASTSSAHLHHRVEDDGSDSDHETINIDDPFIFASTDGVGGGAGNEAGGFGERNSNDTDINEIDWTQTQGITPDSSLAWALDGHIRMRNEVSNRLFTQTGLVRFIVLFYQIVRQCI